MNPTRIIGIILIVGGIAALAFGGFSFTKDSTVAKVGPIELSAKRKEDVNIPSWVGIGAIVLGGVLIVVGKK
jgi:drug/metabolite transporter (DMT)-like permease